MHSIFHKNLICFVFGMILLLSFACKRDFGDLSYESSIKDIDGNIYPTVKIGEQVWMASNLRVHRFCNGDSIPYICDTIKWDSINSDTVAKAAYCYYGNDTTARTLDTLGALYNWYAASDGRKLCPQGYHLPSKVEWERMVKFLGGKDKAGARLKSNDSSFWTKPVLGLNDVLGFNALPAGGRDPKGLFDNRKGLYGFFWTSTAYENRDAWIFYVFSNHEAAITKYSRKGFGYSVRCIKD
ncbi:MAG: fibrobacter succinogenes major paralogous domain-containing protein [Bacteroidales bacterium]